MYIFCYKYVCFVLPKIFTFSPKKGVFLRKHDISQIELDFRVLAPTLIQSGWWWGGGGGCRVNLLCVPGPHFTRSPLSLISCPVNLLPTKFFPYPSDLYRDVYSDLPNFIFNELAPLRRFNHRVAMSIGLDVKY